MKLQNINQLLPTFVCLKRNEDKEAFWANAKKLDDYLSSNLNDYEIIVTASDPANNLFEDAEDWILHLSNVRVLRLAFAVSEEVALSAGMENSIGDICVFWDVASDPIDLITDFIELYQKGNQVIMGTTKFESSIPYYVTRKLTGIGLGLIDYRMPSNATGLWCLGRNVVNALGQMSGHHQPIFVRILRLNLPVISVEYTQSQSTIGKKYLLSSMQSTWQQLVFNSLKPLRFATLLGFLASLGALAIAVYVLVIKLIDNTTIEGWASIMFVVSLLFSLMFIILAMFAEYIGRLLHEQNEQRDQIVLEEIYNHNNRANEIPNVLVGQNHTSADKV